MAGLFSLGPHSKEEQKEEREHNNNNNNNNNNSSSNIQLLFRNEEIYSSNRGFEIWPQTNYYSFGLGPSSSSHHHRNNSNNNNNNNNNINDDVSVSFSDESTRFGFTVMRSSSGSGLGTGTNCQDCGNQAKKDCVHLRCRTCCRSRGFQCSTHVKSTWVPASKRRERQQQLTALQHQQEEQQQFRGGDVQSRRHREQHQGAAGASGSHACVPVPITTTGLELGQFPPELNSPAVFRCVKVSPMDAPDERYAYQTAVNIGGHVFKGILYDQGADGPFTTGEGGEGSSHGGEAHDHQLSLITTTATTSSANPMFDPSQLYPPPMNAFMAGTQFFPPPRS